MKKPTLAKLDLEKERLNKNLKGLPLSERLEMYGHSSNDGFKERKMAIQRVIT
jgi:hypothetical protein